VLEDMGIALNEDPGELEDEEEISDKTRYIREFWPEFIDELRLDDPSQPLAKPTKGQNINFNPVSQGPFWISAYLAPASNEIGVYLRFIKGEYGDELYEALKEDQEAINSELGIPVTWESDGKKHSVASRQKGIDALDVSRRKEVKEFLSDRVNRFINVFRPRLTEYVEHN
jgi:hypothetical protein